MISQGRGRVSTDAYPSEIATKSCARHGAKAVPLGDEVLEMR